MRLLSITTMLIALTVAIGQAMVTTEPTAAPSYCASKHGSCASGAFEGLPCCAGLSCIANHHEARCEWPKAHNNFGTGHDSGDRLQWTVQSMFGAVGVIGFMAIITILIVSLAIRVSSRLRQYTRIPGADEGIPLTQPPIDRTIIALA